MGWSETGWNWIGYSQMGCNGVGVVGWSEMGCSWIGYSRMGCIRVGYSEVGSIVGWHYGYKIICKCVS